MCILIPEPYILTPYDIAMKELFIMESNANRMKYMIEQGFYCDQYSEEKWLEFKKWHNQINNNM